MNAVSRETFIDRRPIPSAPGYFATIDGNIIGKRGGVIAPHIYASGYARVLIHLSGGKTRNVNIQRLICEAFNGVPPSPKHQAAHCDGNKSNNKPSNLRWATSKENHADRKLHGTWPTGSKNNQAKLTEEQAAIIKSEYRAAMKPSGFVARGKRQELAQRFGVSIYVIKNVAAGNTWRHVSIDLPFLPPPDEASV